MAQILMPFFVALFLGFFADYFIIGFLQPGFTYILPLFTILFLLFLKISKIKSKAAILLTSSGLFVTVMILTFYFYNLRSG